jgi:DNA uptake protein ComE-like DNA-binding protein
MRIPRLATLLLLPALAIAQDISQTQSAAHPRVPEQHTIAPSSTLLDINTATFDQLRALPGFGAVYARRVIAGRPYVAKNQLLTRGVLPLTTYTQISPLIIAHHSRK